jgi:hypothetical protein
MPSLTRSLFAVLAAALLVSALPALAADSPQILPLSQIKPGMKGVAYTIFQGDQIEKFEVEVIGVMPNLLGPKQDIVLIKLLGPKVEETGVVAGMSGSPVYIDGKLAGAISLKFGIFTKEPIGGMTPIEQMLDVENAERGAARASAGAAATPAEPSQATAMAQFPVPADLAGKLGLGNGAFLTPIETPLVFSGFYRGALARFSDQFAAFGMVPSQGGTVPARPDDAQLQPGDMAGIVLIAGDLSLNAGCTVTARVGDRVFLCGHPVLGFGNVAMPLARGHVLTTLSSSFNSTKIMNAGGVIGTVTEDRLTAVMGRLGPAPRMIPVELSVATPEQVKEFNFQVIENAKLTPLLVAIAAFNGLVANTAYSEGTTFQLDGEIDIAGHSPVHLEDMFVPTDMPFPDGFFLAVNVQSAFARIFNNPYELPYIQGVTLHIQSIPERRLAAIDSAWSEKSEVSPGETIRVKVLLRPYRGTPFIQEVPVTIPAQAAKGNLRILVSDSETLNRMNRFFSSNPQARLPGLEELIKLLNRERRNDRLYVTLLQPTPTLLVEDKELPNAPLSEINVLDQRRNPGSTMLLWESSAGEWSVPMNQVISGQHYLTIAVK